ncbi:MAG: hypothetical protein JW922_01955 [Paludibacteraceae bacterium]|nr:hypothetical protein [Paludibacteraceae bacterium]
MSTDDGSVPIVRYPYNADTADILVRIFEEMQCIEIQRTENEVTGITIRCRVPATKIRDLAVLEKRSWYKKLLK